MWKIIQQLCEDIRGNLTVYEAVVLMMTALGSLRCHDKSRVIPVGYSMLLILYITLLRRTPEYNEEIRYLVPARCESLDRKSAECYFIYSTWRNDI